jgi:hypothetical protein
MPEARLTERIRSGSFDTTLPRLGDTRYDAATLDRLYRKSTLLDRYYVLSWDREEPSSHPTAASSTQER